MRQPDRKLGHDTAAVVKMTATHQGCFQSRLFEGWPWPPPMWATRHQDFAFPREAVERRTSARGAHRPHPLPKMPSLPRVVAIAADRSQKTEFGVECLHGNGGNRFLRNHRGILRLLNAQVVNQFTTQAAHLCQFLSPFYLEGDRS